MGIREREKREKGRGKIRFFPPPRAPLAFSRVPFPSFCLLRRPPLREPVGTQDRHLEIITDIHNLLSPVFHMCGKSDGKSRFCFSS